MCETDRERVRVCEREIVSVCEREKECVGCRSSSSKNQWSVQRDEIPTEVLS